MVPLGQSSTCLKADWRRPLEVIAVIPLPPSRRGCKPLLCEKNAGLCLPLQLACLFFSPFLFFFLFCFILFKGTKGGKIAKL